MEIIWTNEALRKPNKFADYIVYDYKNAEIWILKLIERTDQLIDQPNPGPMAPKYDEPVQSEIIYGNYRIIYRVRKEGNAVYIKMYGKFGNYHLNQVNN